MINFGKLSGYLLSVLTLFAVVSCDNRLIEPIDPDSGHGGNNRRDNASLIKMTRANADYYGSYYNDQTSDFLLYLSVGNTDTEGYFTDEAVMLTLDILSRAQSTKSVPTGEFLCGNSKNAMTFVPGFLNKDDIGEFIDGSALYVQNSVNEYANYPVTDGKVTIESVGIDLFKITARFIADGQEFYASYEGRIPVTDKSQTDPGTDPISQEDDINFPGIKDYQQRAKALYNGQLYDGSDDYTLIIYAGEYGSDGNFLTKGHEIALDILTPLSDGKSIKYGTYSCTGTDFTPYHFLDGLDEDGTIYPSYFYKQYSVNEFETDLITGGTAYIGQTNDGSYTIKVYFATPKNSFLVNYEGPVEFIDNRTKSPLKARTVSPVSADTVARQSIGALSERRKAR